MKRLLVVSCIAMLPCTSIAQQVPIIDPTENVKALAAAGEKRADDIRQLSKEIFDAKLKAESNLNELRFKFTDELRKATTERLDSEAKLRAEYTAIIAQTEKARVDAIRLVDKSAIDIQTSQGVTTATALAKAVTESAEVLRTQQARQAEDLRTTFTQGLGALTARIAALELGSAEGRGKQTYQDPALAELTRNVQLLVASRADQAGINTGRGDIVGWIAGGLGLLIAAGSLIIAILKSRLLAAAGR